MVMHIECGYFVVDNIQDPGPLFVEHILKTSTLPKMIDLVIFEEFMIKTDVEPSYESFPPSATLRSAMGRKTSIRKQRIPFLSCQEMEVATFQLAG